MVGYRNFIRIPDRPVKRLRAGDGRVLWQNNFFSFSWLLPHSSCPQPVDGGAGDGETSIRVEVDMVQLNVAVMDSKGNYVTGLRLPILK